MPITINGSDGITNASWTTGTRPSNPVAGQMGFNTETKTLEFYDAETDEWNLIKFIQAGNQISATGGTVTDITEDGTQYRVHQFTSVDDIQTFEIIGGSGTVEYLLVGGGGGGGGGDDNVSVDDRGGGGGGAGGVVIGERVFDPGLYTIGVGSGGRGADERIDNNDTQDFTSEHGESSSIDGVVTALGGARGGDANQGSSQGGDGASGGGGARSDTGGFGTPPQGFNGADGNDDGGGGGGGAGGAGFPADASNLGAGGDGIDSSITGTITTYSKGGSGNKIISEGGFEAFDESPNTGNGGPGGEAGLDPTFAGGGNGGSGIVVLRYQI
jgi:hypothetical protein